MLTPNCNLCYPKRPKNDRKDVRREMWSWIEVIYPLVTKLDGHGLPITKSELSYALSHVWVDPSSVPHTRENPFGIREAMPLEEIAEAYARYEGNTRAVMMHFSQECPVSKATVVLAELFKGIFEQEPT